METNCSCGAKLVEDARFCHRCGRPVGGVEPVPEPDPETAAEPSPPEPAAPPQRMEIGFRNGMVVRVAFIAASLNFLLLTMTTLLGIGLLQMVLPFFFSAAGGFYAVYLYRRRTGDTLTPTEGARVGWITGVFSFVISTVLFTVGMIGVASEGGLPELYRKNAAAMGLPAGAGDQLTKLLENPGAIAAFIVLLLAVQFIMLALPSSLGGALGAKALDRE